MRRRKKYETREWIATMRLTDKEAAITRSLADKHFDGNLSETLRTAVTRLAAEYESGTAAA